MVDASGAVAPIGAAPMAGVTGSFQGDATFQVTQRPRSGGGTETMMLNASQSLRITIAANGDVGGSGFALRVSGNIQLTDAASQRYTGTLTATGCTDARFSGMYMGASVHPEDGNTVSMKFEREVEDATMRTKMRVTARATRV